MGNFENIVVFIRLQVHLYKIGFIQNIESRSADMLTPE
jgi:hypothetical protein